MVKNSPTKPQLTVCNSCVVTEDKNQFATRLVPLTDKEIEVGVWKYVWLCEGQDTLKVEICSKQLL